MMQFRGCACSNKYKSPQESAVIAVTKFKCRKCGVQAILLSMMVCFIHLSGSLRRGSPHLQHDDLEAQVPICAEEAGVKRWKALVQYAGDILVSNQRLSSAATVLRQEQAEQELQQLVDVLCSWLPLCKAPPYPAAYRSPASRGSSQVLNRYVYTVYIQLCKLQTPCQTTARKWPLTDTCTNETSHEESAAVSEQKYAA